MTLADGAGIAYVAVSSALLVAQATTDAIPDLIQPLTPVASVGFAVWYGWYVTSKAFPRMSELHKLQVAELTKTYMEHMERDRLIHQDERKFHNQQTEALRDRVHDMANTMNNQTMQVVIAIENLAKVAGVVEDAKGGK